ncbi:MAG: insulinase family protein [Firmicutes bacterium]|nr:insulinase family protein [Bacillota bacterium]
MYEKTVLPNGIRILTEYIPYVRSVSIGFWYGAGSKHENEHNNGISHLIEHLTFKGTKNRTARQIAETFDSSGGQLNAFTSKEYTCYYARILDNHFDMAVEVLGDMLLNALFSEADLEKEKSVVLEEIKMYEDTPDELVHDLLTQAILDHHPLGRNILGTVESVTGISRPDVMAYLKERYTSDNLVVAAAGNVRQDQVVKEVEKYFGGVGGQLAFSGDEIPVLRSQTLIRQKKTEQVHLCLGMPGIRRNDPRKYALYLLDVILGGGMSSRLFQELREERALVYSTYSYHVSYQETGLFTVYAGTSPGQVDKVLALMKEEFAKVRSGAVGDEEFRRAKEQLKGSLMLSLESTTNRMSRIAKSDLFHERILSPDEVTAQIDAVTMADLNKIAGEILNEEMMTLAAIGPLKGAEPGKGKARVAKPRQNQGKTPRKKPVLPQNDIGWVERNV